MTPWRWWAGVPGEDVYDLASDCLTREEAIREALKALMPGERFRIIEARSSEDVRHEGSECVPFLRTRNEETLTAGPALPTQSKG